MKALKWSCLKNVLIVIYIQQEILLSILVLVARGLSGVVINGEQKLRRFLKQADRYESCSLENHR
jgi:hypothetical protein